MNKITVLFLGLIASPTSILKSAAEPVIPTQRPAEEKRTVEKTKKELKTIITEINAEYKLQADVFRTSSQEAVSPVKYLPEQLKRSKKLLENLDILAQTSGSDKLHEYAEKLRPITIKSFNAAEAINNNIEDALGDSNRRDDAREIVTTSIDKLSSLGLDFKSAATFFNQYDTRKYSYRESAVALKEYALAMQQICDKARLSAQSLMRATKPTKSKNVFKRVFGK